MTGWGRSAQPMGGARGACGRARATRACAASGGRTASGRSITGQTSAISRSGRGRSPRNSRRGRSGKPHVAAAAPVRQRGPIDKSRMRSRPAHAPSEAPRPQASPGMQPRRPPRGRHTVVMVGGSSRRLSIEHFPKERIRPAARGATFATSFRLGLLPQSDLDASKGLHGVVPSMHDCNQ